MPAVSMRWKMVMFDRSIIHHNWNRINRTPIVRAGLLVRKIMRNSIRRRKRRIASAPGKPPFSHSDSPKGPPFKLIFSKPSFGHVRAYVGMVGFGGSGPPVPGLHEHGGNANRKVFKVVGRRMLKRNFKNRPQKGLGGLIIKRVVENVHYPKRPFAVPALNTAIPKLPAMWKNSFNRK